MSVPLPLAMCPSAPAAEGAVVLGAATEDGGLAYVTPRAIADPELLDAAGGRPERALRFALPCIEGRCGNWTGSRCGLIDALTERATGDEQPDPARLPKCAIRASCRWYAQARARACAACPRVRFPA